ncbi:Hypothetical_protein [Hexamita inflata]|uniref:Hypothetical_protein n=2 Tax=Hexamita inflata TaxID=28002 RepID=A0AA86U9S8_9EUKA|nr:Hypothetical protein HINF_LOCUS30617 [Hexamita inflata]
MISANAQVRSRLTLPTVRQAAPMFMFRAGFNRQAQLPREPELLLVTATVKIDPSVELCLPTGPLLFFILTNSQRLVLVCSAVQTQNCSKLSCSQLVSLRQNSSRPFGKNEYILKRRLPVGPDAAYIQSNLKNGPQIAPPPVSSVPLTPVGHQEIALVSSARRLQMELEGPEGPQTSAKVLTRFESSPQLPSSLSDQLPLHGISSERLQPLRSFAGLQGRIQGLNSLVHGAPAVCRDMWRGSRLRADSWLCCLLCATAQLLLSFLVFISSIRRALSLSFSGLFSESVLLCCPSLWIWLWLLGTTLIRLTLTRPPQ